MSERGCALVAGYGGRDARFAPSSLDEFNRRCLNVPHEPQARHQTNDQRSQVELPPGHTVVGHRRERVVIMMPTFTEGEQADQPVVATLVFDVKGTIAEGVANRVDRPGDVIDDDDAHESTPEETLPTRDQVGDDQAERDPQEEGAV